MSVSTVRQMSIPPCTKHAAYLWRVLQGGACVYSHPSMYVTHCIASLCDTRCRGRTYGVLRGGACVYSRPSLYATHCMSMAFLTARGVWPRRTGVATARGTPAVGQSPLSTRSTPAFRCAAMRDSSSSALHQRSVYTQIACIVDTEWPHDVSTWPFTLHISVRSLWMHDVRYMLCEYISLLAQPIGARHAGPGASQPGRAPRW